MSSANRLLSDLDVPQDKNSIVVRIFYKSTIASATEREREGGQRRGNDFGVNGHGLVFLLTSISKDQEVLVLYRHVFYLLLVQRKRQYMYEETEKHTSGMVAVLRDAK